MEKSLRSSANRRKALAKTSVLLCGNRCLRGLLLVLLCLPALPIRAQSPMSIVELVDMDKKVQPARLQKLCRQKGYTDVNIYYWHPPSSGALGHLVAYGPTAHLKQLLPLLKKAYSPFISFYEAPFYKFDRHYCSDKTVAKQWDNILLMARLVADTVKQQQYLSYHATQFQQWPEVAQGFCNASFQQLLVFRQGRRLMLVISIPHRASLDELNPKTSLNNPRVDDWNALMKQYQEGLPGTKPGEVWVVPKPVTANKPVLAEQ